MADRILLSAEHEVAPLLEQMELDRQKLIDILRVAAADRAQCTRNDVHGFELILMNDKVVRGLRDAFGGPSWGRLDEDNQEGIENSKLKLRVIACNFDHNTAHPTNDPTNIARKGQASRKKAHCNFTGWLPGLPDIPVQASEEYTTWVLGSHVDNDGVLKGELSLPVSFSNGQYGRFAKRIILLDGRDDVAAERTERTPDQPFDIVDIQVRRK